MPAPQDDAVTVWLEQIRNGNRAGVDHLFVGYFQRLVALAAGRLQGRPELHGLEEDVALSALKSLCLGAERGRFPELGNRDALWRLLACMTIRKSIDLLRKRRPEQPLGERDLDQWLQVEPTPDEVAELSEQICHLLDRLAEPDLRQIALWKVEGFTNREIAQRLGSVERTVERKLHRIRLTWQDELRP